MQIGLWNCPVAREYDEKVQFRSNMGAGHLRFEHELINWDDEYSYIRLPIDESASLQENIILRNVKDM